MIIIGELINASRKAIKAAIEAKDAAAIQQVARDQAEAGADYIDVNAGKGLDEALINPLDKRMMVNIVAAEALAGRDNFCMNYLKAFRAGILEESV